MALLLILSIFLFVGGESQQQHRLFKDLWDAGHLLLFGLISFSYYNQTSKKTIFSDLNFFITTVFCLFVGYAIEFAQLFTAREFSYDDIINDLIGAYLDLLALEFFRNKSNTKYQISISIVFILLLLTGLRGLEKDLTDEYNLKQQFPLIAGFENTLELDR